MKGFTLIELIIYIAIVSVVLVLASSFTWDIIWGGTKATCYREVQQNARFAMEKIIRALRAGSDPSIFYVSEDILYQDGVALTSDQVKVTNFTITSIANTYKINLEVGRINPWGRSEYEAVVGLNSTVCLLPGGAPPPSQDCWGTGGSCDPLCRYADYGPLTGWYDNPDPLCNATCSITGYFYLNPSGVCSNDGSGSCYKMENLLSASTTYTEGDPCEEGCARTCTPCEQLNRQQCRQQEGCDWDWWQRQCVDDPGCISCDEFPDPPSCGPGPNQPQYGCSWESTKWYWDLADSLEGYLASTTCQWYE